MILFHIPQYTILNRNMHISALNVALCDMGWVHCGICEFGIAELIVHNSRKCILNVVCVFYMFSLHPRVDLWPDMRRICITVQWRHNGRDVVSNYQCHDCLLNREIKRRSKKTSKLRVTGLVWGEFTGPAQMASNVENVSIWWRHHEPRCFTKNVIQ